MKKIAKKITISLFLAVFSVFCISFAVTEGQKDIGTESEGGRTEVTYYTFSAAPDHLEDLDQMIDLFEDQSQDIKVKVETAPWSDYFNKLQLMVAGDVAPDVFELNYENFVTYAAKGALMDLSPMIQADSSFSPEIFYPKSYQAFQYRGMQYGLPETFSTVVLFYNKDLFDEAGLEYPTEQWTWEDAVAAAKKIRDPQKDIWGLYSSIQFWEFYKKIAQNGGSIFSTDGKQVTINSPQNREALQTMLDMVHKHHVMPSSAEIGGISDGDLFLSGKLGMVVSGIWMFASFNGADFNWDIEVEPGMTGKATHFFANTIGISKDCKKKEAAWKWVKFFASSPEMALIRINAGWELPTLQDANLVKDYLEQQKPANRQAVFNSLKYSVVPPVIERQSELQDVVGLVLERANLGEIDAAAALAECEKKVEELLQ